jgi:hypothetical protein
MKLKLEITLEGLRDFALTLEDEIIEVDNCHT